MGHRFQFLIINLVCVLLSPLLHADAPLYSDHKPKMEALLKPKSLTRVLDDYDVITNSEWTDDNDFRFVNAVLIRAPLKYARPSIMDFSLYKNMSSAIQKFEYNPKTKLIEIKGEYNGLRMHSWVRVDQKYWDEIHYEIVRGNMEGFKIDAYLWEKPGDSGKTLAIATGFLPKGRNLFTGVIALLFKPASEIVIGVATKNFRSYIEEEYKKKK